MLSNQEGTETDHHIKNEFLAQALSSPACVELFLFPY